MGGGLKIIISLRRKLLHQKSRKGNQRNILYSILNTCGFTVSLLSWRLKLFQTHISQSGLWGHSSGAQGGSVQKKGSKFWMESFFLGTSLRMTLYLLWAAIWLLWLARSPTQQHLKNVRKCLLNWFGKKAIDCWWSLSLAGSEFLASASSVAGLQ